MTQFRRLLACATLACALTLAAPLVASAQPLVYHQTGTFVVPHGDFFGGDLQCPSATVCTAAGELLGADYNGYIVSFNPQHAGTVSPTKTPLGRFAQQSCPSVTQCSAVEYDGSVYTYDPSSPSTGTTLSASGGSYGNNISCPTTNECTTELTPGVGTTQTPGYRQLATFDPQSSSTQAVNTVAVGTTNGGGSVPLIDLACGSATACTAVDLNGEAYTFDPQVASSSPIDGTEVDPDAGASGNIHLACPTASECVTLDRDGNEATFNPAAPGNPALVALRVSGGIVGNVTCPSTTLCTTGLQTFDPTDPAATLSAATAPGLLACASTAECTVLNGGSHGTQIYVGLPGTPPTAGAPTVSKAAVKGSAASVPVSCASYPVLACSVKLTLTVRVKGHRKTLGSTSQRIAAGKKATVTVRLSRAGVALLNQRRRLPVTLSIAAKGAKTTTRTVTFTTKRR